MDVLAAHLTGQPGPPRPVLLGYSGGLDSSVLLDVLAATPALHAGLRAIHVHHGLQAQADDWAAHCLSTCARLGVPLRVIHVDVAARSPLGPEGAARAARHAAFADALRDGEVLALAHHADDQAETFLLRALRASGPDGLAAMQPWRANAGGWLWRPLLALPREALAAHAHARGLQWIEDPSNADPRHARNFLRQQVLPQLRARWPEAGVSLARSAGLCAEAVRLLDNEDHQALVDAGTGSCTPATLDARALEALPRERRARVLRRWIASLGLPPLPGHGVDRVESALLPTDAAAGASFEWSGACLRRWRDLVYAGLVRPPLPRDWQCRWDGKAPLALPGGGQLRLDGAAGFEAPLRAHARQGGERIVLPGRTHHHALKHVLQDLGVPPWARERLPLLSGDDGALLAAGDRVVAASLHAWLQQRGARLAWTP